GADGRRAVELGHRCPRLPDRARRREARVEHLPEAASARRRRHAPSRSGGRRLPQVLAAPPETGWPATPQPRGSLIPGRPSECERDLVTANPRKEREMNARSHAVLSVLKRATAMHHGSKTSSHAAAATTPARPHKHRSSGSEVPASRGRV